MLLYCSLITFRSRDENLEFFRFKLDSKSCNETVDIDFETEDSDDLTFSDTKLKKHKKANCRIVDCIYSLC